MHMCYHIACSLLLSLVIIGKYCYYIDMCELWGFIREINFDIAYVKYQFYPTELLLHNYKCGGYVPCCVTVNTYTIVR